MINWRPAIYHVHPHFRTLLSKLRDEPIACPEVSEGEVGAASTAGHGTQYWADYVATKLSRHKSAFIQVG